MSSPPPPSQGPPSQGPPPGQGWGPPPSQEPPTAQWGAPPPPRPPRRGRPWYQRPRIVIPAAIVGLLVVFGVIGALAGPPPSTVKPSVTIAAATVAPTVEATLPTTTAPSTTAPPTTARPTTTHPSSTALPTTRPAPPMLRVTIISLPATGQGNSVTATARTAPGANCTIDVEYKSGPSHAAGLGPKTASSAGAVSWTWLVGTRTTPGDWPVTVTCSTDSASQSDERELTVLDTGKPG